MKFVFFLNPNYKVFKNDKREYAKIAVKIYGEVTGCYYAIMNKMSGHIEVHKCFRWISENTIIGCDASKAFFAEMFEEDKIRAYWNSLSDTDKNCLLRLSRYILKSYNTYVAHLRDTSPAEYVKLLCAPSASFVNTLAQIIANLAKGNPIVDIIRSYQTFLSTIANGTISNSSVINSAVSNSSVINDTISNCAISNGTISNSSASNSSASNDIVNDWKPCGQLPNDVQLLTDLSTIVKVSEETLKKNGVEYCFKNGVLCTRKVQTEGSRVKKNMALIVDDEGLTDFVKGQYYEMHSSLQKQTFNNSTFIPVLNDNGITRYLSANRIKVCAV